MHLNNAPNDPIVNAEIVMNHDVPRPDDALLFDLRRQHADSLRYPIGCFSQHLQVAQHRVGCFVILQELVEGDKYPHNSFCQHFVA